MKQTKWQDVREEIRPPCPLCKNKMIAYGPVLFPPSKERKYYWRCKNHGCTKVLEEMTSGEVELINVFIEETLKNPVRWDDGIINYMYKFQILEARLLNGETPVIVDCAHGSEDAKSYLECCAVCGALMKVLYIPGTTWLACCKKECYDAYVKARP